jgi:tetratricopeptide (TPR) repeat protein
MLTYLEESPTRSSDLPDELLALSLAIHGTNANHAFGQREAHQDLFKRARPLAERSPRGVALAIVQVFGFYVVGFMPDKQEIFEQGVALVRDSGDSQILATMILNLALYHQRQGAFDIARQHLQEALSICEQHNYRWMMGNILRALGNIAHQQAKYEEAYEYHRHSLALWQGRMNWVISLGLQSLALAEAQLGRREQARQHFLESQVLAEQVGHVNGMAGNYTSFGLTLWRWGEHEQAIQQIKRVVDIKRETGDKLNLANALVNLGHPTAALGAYREAWSYYHEALELALNQSGQYADSVIAEAVMGLGHILGVTGHPAAGVRYVSAGREAVGRRLQVEMEEVADQLLEPLTQMLSPADFEAALEDGRHLDLETVIAELLATEPPEDRKRD